MRIELVLLAAVAVLSWLITRRVRHRAVQKGLLDVPNERSSHTIPTPRGGGVAIAASVTSALLVLAASQAIPLDLAMALAGGGAAVAFAGFIDDRRGLSSKTRLPIHFAAALWALAWLGGLPPLQLGAGSVTFGWGGYLLGAVGVVWTLNLFNFMDGIDGFAASEAVFIACSGALLACLAGVVSGMPWAALALAAGCLGFLLWNWPPAKIFLGDVGSGYLGYMVAVLAIACARENPTALLVWAILGGIFLVDATITLARRVARRERFDQAHRSHAYQRLTRRWGSHARVTLSAIAVNVFWLLPCAWFATSNPRFAAWTVVVALVPIAAGVLAAGAGKRD